MAGDYFESALNSLMKDQEKHRLLKILNEIRKGVEGQHRKDNIKKMYDRNCLSPIIKTLEGSHLDVISFSLSILGYCCLDRQCARDVVRKYNILAHLNHLLKNHKQDGIQGRIFRIIGNICHHWERLANHIIENEKKLHLIAKMLDSIEKFVIKNEDGTNDGAIENGENEGRCTGLLKKSLDGTIGMALRALKKLLNSGTVLPLVEDCQVFKVLGGLLLKLTSLWEKSKQFEEVLQTTLTLIFEYSLRFQSYNVITQLHFTSKGNALECLPKLVVLSPLLVVKLSVSLAESLQNKNDVPFVEISQSFIRLLEDPTPINCSKEDLRYSDYLKYLCFLLKQPFICNNKDRILDCNLISLFLSILKYNKTISSEVNLKNTIAIVSTLKSRYMFENQQHCLLLKSGIINIFSNILNQIVGSDSELNVEHRFKLRSSDDLAVWLQKPMYHFEMAPIQTDFCRNQCKRSLSPSSDTSSGPSYSPPCSPLSLSEEDPFGNDSSSSDNYSPVCSDTEEKSPVLSLTTEDYNTSDELEDEKHKQTGYSMHRTNEISKSRQRGTQSHKKQLCYEITNLLKIFMLMKPPPQELISSELPLKLLRFVIPENKHYCNRETVNLIKTIAGTPTFLLGLMQSNFITTTHSLLSTPHGINCSVCASMLKFGQSVLSQFTKVLEKGCGQGDIAHQLYRGNLTIKEKLLPVIPFITSNKKILRNLFITCGGLNILIRVIRKNSADNSFVKGLCCLATKLGIKNPMASSKDESGRYIDLENYEMPNDQSTMVTFKFDDGVLVKADRLLLIEKSNYFNNLLCGTFKESEENEVILHNICSKSFKVLVTLLQHDLNSMSVCRFNVDLNTLLDVIVLTDYYIMDNLGVCLSTSVQYFKFDPVTVSSIYQWSIESKINILRVECVVYALVGLMNDNERCNLFKNILKSGFSEYLASDLEQLLSRFYL